MGRPRAPRRGIQPDLFTRRIFEKGRLRIDFDAYEVFVDGHKAELLLREFEILAVFVQNPMRVLTREELLAAVYGGGKPASPRAIDVHVRRLRQRLEADAAHPRVILTVQGVGYQFDARGLQAEILERPPMQGGSNAPKRQPPGRKGPQRRLLPAAISDKTID